MVLLQGSCRDVAGELNVGRVPLHLAAFQWTRNFGIAKLHEIGFGLLARIS